MFLDGFSWKLEVWEVQYWIFEKTKNLTWISLDFGHLSLVNSLQSTNYCWNHAGLVPRPIVLRFCKQTDLNQMDFIFQKPHVGIYVFWSNFNLNNWYWVGTMVSHDCWSYICHWQNIYDFSIFFDLITVWENYSPGRPMYARFIYIESGIIITVI